LIQVVKRGAEADGKMAKVCAHLSEGNRSERKLPKKKTPEKRSIPAKSDNSRETAREKVKTICRPS